MMAEIDAPTWALLASGGFVSVLISVTAIWFIIHLRRGHREGAGLLRALFRTTGHSVVVMVALVLVGFMIIGADAAVDHVAVTLVASWVTLGLVVMLIPAFVVSQFSLLGVLLWMLCQILALAYDALAHRAPRHPREVGVE